MQLTISVDITSAGKSRNNESRKRLLSLKSARICQNVDIANTLAIIRLILKQKRSNRIGSFLNEDQIPLNTSYSLDASYLSRTLNISLPADMAHAEPTGVLLLPAGFATAMIP